MNRVWQFLSRTLVAAFLIYLAAAYLAPAAMWLDVRRVMVPDTTEGSTPVLLVERTIRQNFYGTYTVDVERQQPSGRFAVVCSVTNSTHYRSDAELPDPLTLDWWTWPVQCQIGAGTYRVESYWRIQPELVPDKFAYAMSNVFTIHPAEAE